MQKHFFSKHALVIAIVLAFLAIGGIGFLVLHDRQVPAQQLMEQPEQTTQKLEKPTVQHQVIGTSVEGRNIEVFSYGNGPTHLLFVGGIHGGYEWNSVVLAYQFMDYLQANPQDVPADLTISVVPAANPDGVYKIVGTEGRITADDVTATKAESVPGRLNANDVDLNRNFNCHWQSTSTWQGRPESAGTAAFSEPEAQAIRNYVQAFDPSAVVFWHSASGAVYASECDNGVLPETIDVMDTYANAAGYNAVKSFDAYPITGDAEGWLASIGIPAVTVEMTTHQSSEWEKNLAGSKALMAYYQNKSVTSAQ